MPSSASPWKVRQRSRRSTGSRPTVGSSRTSTSGAPSSAVASETRERSPPESVWTTWPACAAEGDGLDRLLDRRRRRAEDAARSSGGSRARSGRRRRREPASRSRSAGAGRRAGREAVHGDLARLDDLHADDRAHQGRLAGAARAQQAGDDAASDVGETPGRTSLPPRRTCRSRIRIGVCVEFIM